MKTNQRPVSPCPVDPAGMVGEDPGVGFADLIPTDPTVARDAHLARVCHQAGLASMAAFLQFVIDRESLTPEQVQLLDAEDITELYNGLVGPTVDIAEAHLVSVLAVREPATAVVAGS